MTFAYHICELIDGLCPEEQENSAVFELLYTTLLHLSDNPADAKKVHDFEVELLSLLGYYSAGSHDLSGARASYYIERLLERRLKSRQVILKLA